MRVAIISQEYPPTTGWGGIGSFAYGLAHALRTAGVLVDVVSCSEGQDESVTRDGDIAIYRSGLPTQNRALARLGRVMPLTADRVRTALGVRRAVKRLPHPPDVIEAPDWMAESLLLGRARAPVVVHLHGSLGLLSAHRRWPRSRDLRTASRLEWYAARRAQAITSPSLAAARRPDGSPWIRPASLHLSAMPLPDDLLVEPRHPRQPEPVIAMVGRLDRLKAPETLLEAMSELAGIAGLRAVFVGHAHPSESPAGDDYADWLRREAVRRGLDIDVLGRADRQQVLDVYRNARVVAVPSRFESFSMVAVEALACGTPVVVTSACGVAEWLGRVDPGAVVPPDDPGALANALRRLLVDDSRAAQSAAIGRQLVVARCAGAVIAAQRLDLYRKILSAADQG